MIKNQYNKLTLALTALLFQAPSFAFGADPKLNETSYGSLADFLNGIKSLFLGFAGAIAILFIIYGGLQYITSAGNPDKIKTAKSTLTYAIAGLILIILAEVIMVVLTSGLQGIFGTQNYTL